MIASNPEVYQMCHSWLTSIKVPIREPVNLGSVVRATYKAIEPVDTIAIPDRDDEYDIYQDDDVCLGEAAGPTEPALAQQQEYPAAECSGYAVEVGNGASAAITAIPVAQPQPDESVKFPQKVVDLAAREIGIIKALHTTSDRQQRNKLTTELLELLEMSQNISLEDEKKNDVAQNGAASMSTDNDTIAVDCSVKNKNGDSHTGGNMQAEMGKTAVPNGGPEMPLHQPSQQPEHMIQQLAGRKTPPHMRGFGSGRRN
ncbi:hypothetical protein F5Y10DRAFT_249989 [Nemania abortiva]|nr:hypothetical protein F5Y10DRAFT_249989 [Nemania abortiva]